MTVEQTCQHRWRSEVVGPRERMADGDVRAPTRRVCKRCRAVVAHDPADETMYRWWLANYPL